MKSKTTYILLLIIIAIAFYFIEGQLNKNISQENLSSDHHSAIDRTQYLPSVKGELIHHKTYSLDYSEKHEQPYWAVHILEQEDITRYNYERPYFEIDELVTTGAAHWDNYKKSGYDRGHLVPAGDRRKSIEEFNETFLTSNISPQEHEFNAGIWNRIEQKIRYYTKKHGPLYIITGPVFIETRGAIGREQVTVPGYFYKIAYAPHDEKKMIAFLVPHKKSQQSIFNFTTSVDQIEVLTGIDFFPQLPEELEQSLESAIYKNGW